MRKITLSLIAACAVASFLFFNSCKREVASSASSNNIAIAKVNAWLDQQKEGKQPNKAANIDLLKNNLDFSNLRYEKSNGDEQYLIVPIKENFKAATEIDKNLITDLFLVINKSGNIRTGNVVLYTPENGQANKIPDNTFYYIFNTAQPECDGKFQFLAVTGAPQYQLEYKNKHIISSGLYQAKENTSSSVRTSILCYDWFLVTTWYDIAGNIVDQTRVYLYTSCGNCGSPKYMSFCADDGSGGTSDCCIPDPNAQLTSTSISQASGDGCGLETKDKLTGLPTKTCTHSWYFSTNSILFYTWKYGSTEQAMELKDNGIWRFKSVIHMGVITDGMVPPCMTSTCNISSAIPSFSGSVAKMNLIYTLSISYPCAIRGGLQRKTESASSQWIAT